MSNMYFQKLFTLLILTVLHAGTVFSSDSPQTISGYTPDEAIKLGERMYRQGILPSGKSMKAKVMGDIPVDGRMFTCDDCHQRSGLGSLEGTVITWPTNGKELYRPRRRTGAFRLPDNTREGSGGRDKLPAYYQMEDVRPAYTDTSLARLLRSGIDPTERKLDTVMPQFLLGKNDMDILIHYLRNLSVRISPGVDDKTLQLATVIGANVSEQEKQAMLQVLQAHIDAHNAQTRHQERRATSGPFYKTEKHKSYRRLNLTIWELRGPEESWRKQLENYYQKQPVFALLGGIATGSWQQIHAFSEDNKIPCLFPVTDLPVISSTDWYTLYFSKGYYQEGESVAKYIRAVVTDIKNSSIVQIFRKNKPGIALAQGFSETWKMMGGSVPKELILEMNSSATGPLIPERIDLPEGSIMLLWLGQEDLEVFKNLAQQAAPDTMMFTSSTLLKNDFSVIEESFRDRINITYPYSLPAEVEKKEFAVKRWLQSRNIPITDFTTQAKMYFVGWMLPGALKSMRSEFFREYFVEGFDMMTDQDYAVAVYPRLTFGSGQRYASKGCYIVKLGKGSDPELIPVNDWITY